MNKLVRCAKRKERIKTQWERHWGRRWNLQRGKKWPSHFFWKSQEVMGSRLSTARAAGMWWPPQALNAFWQSTDEGSEVQEAKIPPAPGIWKKKRHPSFTPSIHSPQNQLCTYIKAPDVRVWEGFLGESWGSVEFPFRPLLLAPEKVPTGHWHEEDLTAKPEHYLYLFLSAWLTSRGNPESYFRVYVNPKDAEMQYASWIPKEPRRSQVFPRNTLTWERF